jgi:DNA-binding transcriptional LysR family regulator
MSDFDELFAARGLSLDRLRVLERFAASDCSLIKAADHDSGRAAQFSKQVAELKSYFGTNLTVKAGTGLRLTKDGEELVEIVRESFYRLMDFKARCSNLPKSFSIGAGDSLLHWLVIPRISVIQAEHADYSFNLHNLQNAEIINGLLDLSLDFGLARTSQAVQPLARLPLGVKKYALYVPQGLLGTDALAKGAWRELLQSLPLVAQAKSTIFQREFENRAAAEKVKIRVWLYCESVPEVVRAMLTGKYAAVLHGFASRELDPSHFRQINLPFLDELAPKIALMWNPRLLDIRGDSAVGVKDLLGKSFKFDDAPDGIANRAPNCEPR